MMPIISSGTGRSQNPARPLPIIADLHMHTAHSHGQDTVEDMFDAAIAAGLYIVGFSEHSPRPAGYTYPSDYQERICSEFGQYAQEVQALQKELQEQLSDQMLEQDADEDDQDFAVANPRILLGVEIDYIAGQEDFCRDFYASHAFDYAIGGLHFQGTWGFDGPAESWQVLNQDERFAVYDQYYIDLAAMCKTGIFDIAAHPDLVKISTIDSFNSWLDKSQSLELVASALKSIRDNGMLMEVSSAGLRKACAEIYPGPCIMQLAKDLGVSISFASDAHCRNTPAFEFAALANYAYSFGFREYGLIFRGQKEIFSLRPNGAF